MKDSGALDMASLVEQENNFINGPNNLGVCDYTAEEIDEDLKAVDWDQAFEEVNRCH